MSTSEEPLTTVTEVVSLGTTVTSADDANSARGPILAAIYALLFLTALTLNILTLIVWCKVPQLRRPYRYFTINLVLSDLLGAITWCFPSLIAAAAGTSWPLGSGLCTFQGVMSTWVYALTTTTFLVLAFERFLKLCHPSRHPQAFYRNVVIIQLLAVWFYSFILAMLPLVTWGQLDFIDFQSQCHFLFARSTSHLDFLFVVTFCLPLLACGVLYTWAGCKVYIRRRRQERDGETKVILEENKNVAKVSYAQRLQKMQSKYKKKGKLAEEEVGRGQGKLEESSSDSEMSDAEAHPNHTVTSYEEGLREIKARRALKQRVYLLRRRDVGLANLYLVICLIYMALWLPFWVVSYIWVYDRTSAHETVHTLVTVLTYLGICFKPVAFYFHGPFKKAAQAVYPCCKPKAKEERPRATEGEQEPEGPVVNATGDQY